MRKSAFNQNLRVASYLALAFAMVASACTKGKELSNNVDPDAYVAKSDLKGTYSFVVGIEEADSDNTVGATPGMSTDYGLVKARVNEDSLEFDMVYDPNGRIETSKPIISFPITSQFDIQRDKNDYGEQTNKIVEDKKAAWQDRAYIRVDWAHPKTSSASLLSSLMGRTARITSNGAKAESDDGKTLASEEDPTLIETPTIDKDGHISFLVESKINVPDSQVFTFPMSISGGQDYKVTYRTHLLPIKPSDYKPIPYTLKDFSRFGYFFTQQDFTSPEGNFEKNQNLFVNAHNVCEAGRAGSCSTNQIRWVLSKGFPDKYKETARKVVAEWNKVFQKQLNRTDNVVYLDESVQANISDPSMNILAYYPSRTKSGLLGVAQWATNPQTGEFLGVRATIYGDGIDYEVMTVDDKINLLVSDDPLKDVIGTSGLGDPLTYVSPFNDQAMAQSIAANRANLGLDKARKAGAFNGIGATPALAVQAAKGSMDASADKANLRLLKFATKMPEVFVMKDSAMIADDAKNNAVAFPKTMAGFQIPNLNGIEQLVFANAKFDADKEKVMRDAELGIHGTDLVEDAAIRYLYSYLKTKTPQELDQNRKMIEDQIAQLTFYTTALHEMGHAFGLRHNFMGSADQAHFPKEYQDIAARLDAAEKSGKPDPEYVKEDLDPYASSSIMDYTRDFFDQKNGLGEYDKAAIKYVYNRSINKESDPVTLANYMFCTDHQVNENLLCQRFDKGHNLSEMVQGDIDLYEHNYALWHYRRGRVTPNLSQGWGSPRALVSTLLSRVFLPVRQVMDEFLYSFISAQPADGEGYCSMAFIKKSVDAGEINSICTADDMEATHVDPSDLSSFVNALFTYDAKGAVTGFKKSPSQYKPYGMADLLYANAMSMNFFQRVLGSPEPGTYLPVPTQNGAILKAVDASGDIKAQAQQIAQDAQLPTAMAQSYVAQADQLVTEIKVGGYGRQLDSRTSTVGGWIRNESLGSFYDKLAALQAIGIPGLGVRKYMSDSMVGNAYIFPQTKAWTSAMMNKIITGKPYIAAAQVTLKDGRQITAAVPASSNLDLQTYGVIIAANLMSSDTDKSMYSKLQVCNVNQDQCSKSWTGAPVVEFDAADGGDVYRAFQTTAGDSIAFDLVSDAKKVDDQRKVWVGLRDGAGQAQTNALLVLSKADPFRDKILAEVAADPTLGTFKFDATHDWAFVINQEWQMMNDLTKQLTQLSQNAGYNAGIEVLQAFGLLGQQTTAAFKALGDNGKCWVAKYHPGLESAAAKQTADQFNNMIEAKANQSLPGAPAAPAAPVAAPTCDADAAAEVAAGQVRLNLLNLLADEKTLNSDFMEKIVIVDVKTLLAPAQITKTTNTLRSKEAQIDNLRRIVNESR